MFRVKISWYLREDISVQLRLNLPALIVLQGNIENAVFIEELEHMRKGCV